MPTAKPRITITLTDHQHTLLQELSALQEQSMSAIVVDLLDTVVPVLERVAVVLRAAKGAPQSVKDELRRSTESAEAQLIPLAEQLVGQLDLLVGLGKADGVERSPAPSALPSGTKTAAKRAQPPSTNRGVRNSKGKAPKPSTGAASRAIKGDAKK